MVLAKDPRISSVFCIVAEAFHCGLMVTRKLLLSQLLHMK